MDVKVYQLINLDYLDMMSDGDIEMKKVMLDMLFEELPQEIAKMRTLTDAADWNEMKAVSHKMKSTLSFVGCDDMTTSNTEIERVCKEGTTLEVVNGLLTVMEDKLDSVMAELKIEYDRI